MRSETEISAYYQALPDEKITRIALLESADLTKRGLRIILEELDSRGLFEGLQEGINGAVNGLDQPQINLLIEQLKNCPCPVCGSTNALLESGIVIKSQGALFFSITEKSWKFACPPCLEAMMKAARNRNLLSGWVTIKALFSLIQSLARITKNDSRKQAESNIGFLELIGRYPGFFWLYREAPSILSSALAEYNERSTI